MLCACLPAASAPLARGAVIEGVPAYQWYHGCGPTAAASIIGYYDLHGFGNLFDAAGWDDVKLTANVQDQISSPAHNAKYDPNTDDPDLPVPPKTSIADWFGTSVHPLDYGYSYGSKADDALSGYATYRGYEATAWNEYYYPPQYYPLGLTWEDLVAEIDAGRPMLFLVDVDGNYASDHFVPVLGYEDRGDEGKFYGVYTTWSEEETVQWHEFRGMGQSWGVGTGTFFHVTPEPASALVMLIGGLSVLPRRKRRRTC